MATEPLDNFNDLNYPACPAAAGPPRKKQIPSSESSNHPPTNHHHPMQRLIIPLIVFAVMAMMNSNRLCAEPPRVPPDLTQSTAVDRALTYNLGATGLRGWIYTRPATYLDSLQGRTTAASRQILVTHVGAKSPADGVMQVDDLILGAGGKLFTDDARKSLAVAIQEAETETQAGILKLTRWRAGKTEAVQLKLRVMGTYSATAPYQCPKSKRIFDDACKVLANEPLPVSWHGAISGLALLATGNPDYLPKVREFARQMGPASLNLEVHDMGTWESGYRNLFLCEYYLLTGDKEVLHAIREFTLSLAKGQSMYGTFGHGFSDLTPAGKLHGSIPSYGPVNEAGLPANLSIIMGKKCGINDPEVDPAIERATRFFAYYVDKGTIPYGEHEPWPYHDNNGKSAMTAMLFALQGNHTKEAQFFAKMSTAAYRSRECGHTGQGFSYLWGALGANVGGPAAAAAFVKEASWHLDLVRRCDGSFIYDGGEQYGAGKTQDNTYYGKSAYYGLSPNASYVLTYSLPLKKLFITGRDADPRAWLSKQEVAAAIASGSFDLDRKQMPPQKLVAAFSDWSPIVRGWAAEELALRPEATQMLSSLMSMAEGQDAHVRQGACEALGWLKTPEALPVLVRLLSHEDRWLRVKAAKALTRMEAAAQPVFSKMLETVAATAEPQQPIHWVDPVQIAQGALAETVFKRGTFTNAIKDADRGLLYPAIRAVALNADGMARSYLSDTFTRNLTVDDVRALAPEILAAIKIKAPADTMFGNVLRLAGVQLLTKYHFKEGPPALVEFLTTQTGHGSGITIPVLMKELTAYGSAARGVLPEVKAFSAMLRKILTTPDDDNNRKKFVAMENAIAAIEAAKDQPKLQSFKGSN